MATTSLLPQGVTDKRTLEHEFTRTTSYAEAAKRAWEVAAKASLSVEYAGIKGALEVSGKYGEELSRTDAGSETTRDRVSEEIDFVGPVDAKLEAYRSLNRESRQIRAVCDFDGKVYWWGRARKRRVGVHHVQDAVPADLPPHRFIGDLRVPGVPRAADERRGD